MEIITSWETLIMKAHRVGRAKMSGNTDELNAAEADLKAYEEIVKMSDKMILPCTVGTM